jgi:hypothetical protein
MNCFSLPAFKKKKGGTNNVSSYKEVSDTHISFFCSTNVWVKQNAKITYISEGEQFKQKTLSIKIIAYVLINEFNTITIGLVKLGVKKVNRKCITFYVYIS